MQICTLTQTHNHASIPPLSSLQAGCPSCRPTSSVKALKADDEFLTELDSLGVCNNNIARSLTAGERFPLAGDRVHRTKLPFSTGLARHTSTVEPSMFLPVQSIT